MGWHRRPGRTDKTSMGNIPGSYEVTFDPTGRCANSAAEPLIDKSVRRHMGQSHPGSDQQLSNTERILPKPSTTPVDPSMSHPLFIMVI